jgi:hypothetical protein
MKRLGLLGLCLVGGVLGGGAIAWSQATRLPAWYTANQTATSDPATARQAAKDVEAKLQSLRNPQASVKLDQQEINDVVTATIDTVSRQANIPEAIKGVNTEITDGKLKAGAVIDFKKLQSADLSQPKKMILAEGLKQVPGLGDREVYVGIEGSPKISNGQVRLDPDTKLKVGEISVSLKDMANYVGVTPAQLEAEINKALPIALSGLPVDDVNLSDKSLIIRGTEAK